MGWSSGLLFVPRFSDKYGRRPVMVATLVTQTVVLVTMVVTREFAVMCACQFMVGICTVGRWTTGYCYLLELVPPRIVKQVGPCMNASATISVFLGTSLVMISKKSNWIIDFANGMGALSAVLVILLMPETPGWLLAKGKVTQANQVFKLIDNKYLL